MHITTIFVQKVLYKNCIQHRLGPVDKYMRALAGSYLLEDCVHPDYQEVSGFKDSVCSELMSESLNTLDACSFG